MSDMNGVSDEQLTAGLEAAVPVLRKTARTGATPLEDMKGIITAAMDGMDLTHDTAWVRPPGCPCHGGAQSCLLPMEAGSCQGHTAEVPTPPEHVVTAGILLAALPEPDADGNLDQQEAAARILRVIEERLGGEYILRAHHLVRRLTEEAEEYETAHGAHGVPGVPATAPGYQLRCQACGGPLPTGSNASRLTCSDACRQRLRTARKKAAHGKATAAVRA